MNALRRSDAHEITFSFNGKPMATLGPADAVMEALDIVATGHCRHFIDNTSFETNPRNFALT